MVNKLVQVPNHSTGQSDVSMLLISATVPVSLNTAAVTPTLKKNKKTNLDPADFSNYLPISN